MAVDEFGQPGHFCRRNHGRVVGIGQAERDVLAQRALEQRHVLGHAAQVAPHVGRIELAQVDAIEQHGAIGGLVQAHDEPLDRALARADATDQRDAFTGGDLEADALDGRIGSAGVGEPDVAELDVTSQLGQLDEVLVCRPLVSP